MLPDHTQNTRVEKVILSDDKEYRKQTKPTLFERVETQRATAKQILRIEKARADAEIQKLKVREMSARQAVGEEENEEDGNDETKDEVNGDENAAAKAVAEYEDATAHMDEEDAAEFKRIRLEEKERKVLRTRNSHEYHMPVDKWVRRKLAMTLLLNIGTRTKGITEILPWLLLGPKESVMGTQMPNLIERGITHIMNVTHDVQNAFPNQFVYMKIPIRDEEETNIGEKFPQALGFLRRVEEKRGRVLVHCQAGASRAAAMVIAYLVAEREISLADAYTYVRARRPIVSITDHFMFQLAQLELAQDQGCSVLYHKDWKFYEFNMMRADIDPKADWREPSGVLETTLQLMRKREDADD